MLFFCVISCAEDGGAIQQALSKYIGRSTVPQVFINGEHIGGSDGKQYPCHLSGTFKPIIDEGLGPFIARCTLDLLDAHSHAIVCLLM